MGVQCKHRTAIAIVLIRRHALACAQADTHVHGWRMAVKPPLASATCAEVLCARCVAAACAAGFVPPSNPHDTVQLFSSITEALEHLWQQDVAQVRGATQGAGATGSLAAVLLEAAHELWPQNPTVMQQQQSTQRQAPGACMLALMCGASCSMCSSHVPHDPVHEVAAGCNGCAALPPRRCCACGPALVAAGQVWR